MNNLLKLLGLLALAALAPIPALASGGEDDELDFEDDVSFSEGEKLTEAQKLRIEEAKRSGELLAKAAERSAKLAAISAERAARRQPKAIRDAVKAQGKFNVESAKLIEEQTVRDALASIAAENAVDLTMLPSLEELLVELRDNALEEAAFYRSLIALSPADRALALAARSSSDDDDDEDLGFAVDGLNELQYECLEAAVEYAEELGDVADAYAEWQDKLALSLLSPSDYAAELARRASVALARKAELAALPRDAQVWLRKAWSEEEDADEYTAALAYIAPR